MDVQPTQNTQKTTGTQLLHTEKKPSASSLLATTKELLLPYYDMRIRWVEEAEKCKRVCLFSVDCVLQKVIGDDRITWLTEMTRWAERSGGASRKKEDRLSASSSWIFNWFFFNSKKGWEKNTFFSVRSWTLRARLRALPESTVSRDAFL